MEKDYRYVIGLGEVLWDQFMKDGKRSRKGRDLGGADCLKVYDINLRQSYFTKSTIRESLHRADILKLNEEELPLLTNLLGYKMAGEEVLCRRLMKAYHLKMVILTKGTNGSWVLWKGGHSCQGTPQVKVVSAVGAGDAFTGAFIGHYLNGASVQEAHLAAVQHAAYVCTQKGAMPVTHV